MVVPAARRRFSRSKILGGQKRHQRDQAVVKARFDVLPLTRPVTGGDGGYDTEGAIEAGNQIGNWRCRPHGFTFAFTSEAHESAHRLGDKVERRPIDIRPG